MQITITEGINCSYPVSRPFSHVPIAHHEVALGPNSLCMLKSRINTFLGLCKRSQLSEFVCAFNLVVLGFESRTHYLFSFQSLIAPPIDLSRILCVSNVPECYLLKYLTCVINF